jgi:hypothetical protein
VVSADIAWSKHLPLPMTARDGGNAKRLSGTIFAILVDNAEDGQKDKQDG